MKLWYATGVSTNRKCVIWLVACVTVLVVGCAPTQWVAEWQSDSHAAEPVSQVLVIGVGDNPATVSAFETEFATKLRAAGVSATARTEALGDGELSKEIVLQAIKDNGYRAVIVTHLVSVEKTEIVTQPAHYESVYDMYSKSRGYVPAETSAAIQVRLETKLYDVNADGLVWRGIVELNEPSSKDEAISRKIDATVEKLAAAGFVGG